MLGETPLSEADLSKMQQEIVDSHCGMLDLETASAMVLGQRVRDAVMGAALVDNKHADLAILVAGSGHARKDRGVPVYIKSLDQDAKILSLAWLEVKGGVTAVAAYAKHWQTTDFPFDYVWFGPAPQRLDPCEALRKHMGSRKKSS